MKKLAFGLLISTVLWLVSIILFFTVSFYASINIINSIFLFLSIIAAVFWLSIIWRVYKLQYYDQWVLGCSSILGVVETAFYGYYLYDLISTYPLKTSNSIISVIVIGIGLVGSVGLLFFSSTLIISQSSKWITFLLKLKRKFLFRNKKKLVYPDQITEKVIFIDISSSFPAKTDSIYKAVIVAAKVSQFKIEVAEYVFAVKDGMIVKIFKFKDNKFKGVEINHTNLGAVKSRYNRPDLDQSDIGSFVLNLTSISVPKIINKSYTNHKVVIHQIKGQISYNF
ncbi:otopetrin domain-containing protein [Mycoplasma sp. SG1]|uniref:otopetrin domain-containing protein n=1 Tax=Mycoplasma sp. SG1 TaxID=2810348 RepID=UPI002024DA7B|nr:otopetrin domain-containing protein [Mycoplasma sp. SG1]URM53124.1 otopetrin domain-containing protein [Mycoplasma sp. SG1]